MAAILKGDLVADGSVPYEHGSVAYRDFGGQGPAVLLVHGLGGNLAHWGRVAPLLHGRYRLIAIDLPSHGASPPRPSTPSITTSARWTKYVRAWGWISPLWSGTPTAACSRSRSAPVAQADTGG